RLNRVVLMKPFHIVRNFTLQECDILTPPTHFDPCSLAPLISEQYIQGSLISTFLHFLVLGLGIPGGELSYTGKLTDLAQEFRNSFAFERNPTDPVKKLNVTYFKVLDNRLIKALKCGDDPKTPLSHSTCYSLDLECSHMALTDGSFGEVVHLDTRSPTGDTVWESHETFRKWVSAGRLHAV
ncbi:hypothetical protein STEG23_006188, partial [Scotinomys teguina]